MVDEELCWWGYVPAHAWMTADTGDAVRWGVRSTRQVILIKRSVLQAHSVNPSDFLGCSADKMKLLASHMYCAGPSNLVVLVGKAGRLGGPRAAGW